MESDLYGRLAICGLGHLGLITSHEPEPVYYPDGDMGLAWKGKYILPVEKFGEPWSSRNPKLININ